MCEQPHSHLTSHMPLKAYDPRPTWRNKPPPNGQDPCPPILFPSLRPQVPLLSAVSIILICTTLIKGATWLPSTALPWCDTQNPQCGPRAPVCPRYRGPTDVDISRVDVVCTRPLLRIRQPCAGCATKCCVFDYRATTS